jgi:hypothetical protein
MTLIFVAFIPNPDPNLTPNLDSNLYFNPNLNLNLNSNPPPNRDLTTLSLATTFSLVDNNYLTSYYHCSCNE